MFYTLIARLLDYPEAEQRAAIGEMRTWLSSSADLDADERRTVETFLDWLGSDSLTEIQAAYVKTFDLVPEHALHLTHHLFGDDKNRGPALIDLTEFYKEYGLEISTNELPDYLPLMLEFASTLTPIEARVFLGNWTRVLQQLADNLTEAASPYAPLIRLVENRARLVEAAA